jgi:Flp pilus assembly protein TadB
VATGGLICRLNGKKEKRMTKDERHKERIDRTTGNAVDLLFTTIHFLLAVLWIIGLLITVSANALVIAIGVLLIISNFLLYAKRFTDAVKFEKNLEAWQQSVKAELKEELRNELLSLDLEA